MELEIYESIVPYIAALDHESDEYKKARAESFMRNDIINGKTIWYNNFCKDFACYCYNNCLTISVFKVSELHPYKKSTRAITLCSIAQFSIMFYLIMQSFSSQSFRRYWELLIQGFITAIFGFVIVNSLVSRCCIKIYLNLLSSCHMNAERRRSLSIAQLQSEQAIKKQQEQQQQRQMAKRSSTDIYSQKNHVKLFVLLGFQFILLITFAAVGTHVTSNLKPIDVLACFYGLCLAMVIDIFMQFLFFIAYWDWEFEMIRRYVMTNNIAKSECSTMSRNTTNGSIESKPFYVDYLDYEAWIDGKYRESKASTIWENRLTINSTEFVDASVSDLEINVDKNSDENNDQTEKRDKRLLSVEETINSTSNSNSNSKLNSWIQNESGGSNEQFGKEGGPRLKTFHRMITKVSNFSDDLGFGYRINPMKLKKPGNKHSLESINCDIKPRQRSASLPELSSRSAPLEEHLSLSPKSSKLESTSPKSNLNGAREALFEEKPETTKTYLIFIQDSFDSEQELPKTKPEPSQRSKRNYLW